MLFIQGQPLCQLPFSAQNPVSMLILGTEWVECTLWVVLSLSVNNLFVVYFCVSMVDGKRASVLTHVEIRGPLWVLFLRNHLPFV